MNKNRLEAFSDGVFAIVITLLILNIHLPETDYSNIVTALKNLLPDILAYGMSFIIIGVYWISHHNSAQVIVKIDGIFLWLNILLLLFVSFIPFPTALLGRYPNTQIPVILYGVNLIAANLTGFGMILYLYYNPEMVIASFKKDFFPRSVKLYAFVNGLYLLGILVSFYSPQISMIIYLCVIGYVIVNIIRVWKY